MQIAFDLQQAEGGIPVTEVCKKMGISEPQGWQLRKLVKVGWFMVDAPIATT
jgi:hypothetical protein